MTPQEAIRAQIRKNEAILEIVRANAVPGTSITKEGAAMKEREITDINEGLSKALKLLGETG